MTEKQSDLYKKLRSRLIARGIKNVPTVLKVSCFSNQKIFMVIKVLSEEIKNLDSWEHYSWFRQACFEKHGSDFDMIKFTEKEISNVLEYAK
jgi:hypothetical protein